LQNGNEPQGVDKMNIYYESGNISEMKKLVKSSTGYCLKQIRIDAYTPDFIDYSVFKDLDNDTRLGRTAINAGRLEV
jgi:hypothetical protein